LERKVARFLDRYPRVRALAKSVHQRANYVFHRRRSVFCELIPETRIITPMEWAGAEPDAGEWFFGYYDKPPWSANMRFAVFHRPVDTSVELVVFDRETRQTQVVGRTRAWNWQQGSQAQWLPVPGQPALIYNDIDDGRLGCRVRSLGGHAEQFVPWPVQALHPNGREILSLNYKRLYRMRPEYGYAAPVANFTGTESPEQDGIWRVELETGRAHLIVSLAHLMRHEKRPEMDGALHKTNHAIYSPSGSRFVFMHRWIGRHGKFSRLYVCGADGGDLRLLMDDRMVSHYHWRDEDHVLVWGRTAIDGDHYYLLDVNTGRYDILGEGTLDVWGDGHPSFSPDKAWVVTDTYPDRGRLRQLLVFGVDSGECRCVGRFFAPWAYDGDHRCDLHPRWSPDGRWISIDSAHEGMRRSYFIDVSALCSKVDRDSL